MVDIVDSKWSERDAQNNAAAPNGWQSGYLANTIAPTGRQMMAAMKRWHNHANAIYTTTGASNAYVLTFEQGPPEYKKGMIYRFFVNHTNTGPATLNIQTLGAKAIVQQDGTAVKAGQIISGSTTSVVYDGTSFRLEQYVSSPKFSGTLEADAIATSGNLTVGGTINSTGVITATGGITSSGQIATTTTLFANGNINTNSNIAAGGGNVYINSAGSTHLWYQNNGTARALNYFAPSAQAWITNLYNSSGAHIRSMSYSQTDGRLNVEGYVNATGGGYFQSEVGVGAARIYTDGNIAFNSGMSMRGENLAVALDRKANIASPSFTGTVSLPSVSDSSFFQGNGDAANYNTHNLKFKGWWGMGMVAHDNTVNGYYDFRAGKWDTKGGTFKNGTEYVHPNGGRWNISIDGSAGTLRDNVTGRGMFFNWNGQGDQPSWIWGGHDGTNMYVYSPNNMTVKNSAQLGGVAANNYAQFSYSGNQSETFFPVGQTLFVYAGGAIAGRRELLAVYLHADVRYYTLGSDARAQLTGAWRQVGNMSNDWAMYQRIS